MPVEAKSIPLISSACVRIPVLVSWIFFQLATTHRKDLAAEKGCADATILECVAVYTLSLFCSATNCRVRQKWYRLIGQQFGTLCGSEKWCTGTHDLRS